MNRNEWDELAGACATSPEQKAEILRLGAERDPFARVRLLEAVDESPFPLAAWISALALLRFWLEERGLELEVTDRIGYVICAAESAQPSGSCVDLADLVRDFLETYGCDRARRSEPDGP